MKLRASAILLYIVLFLSSLSSCGSETARQIPNYYGDHEVESACFFYWDGEDMVSEPLPESELPDLLETLNAMKLESHLFHADYFWGDCFGLELAYDDGTFLSYDGTYIQLRTRSMTESTDSEYKLRSSMLEVQNVDFWQEIGPYFSAAAQVEPFDTWP